MTRILSEQDISSIEYEVANANEMFNTYIENYVDIINGFENQEIVDTFFVSGNFGKDKQEKIKQIKVLLDETKIIIEDLTSNTRAFLQEQSSLNNSGQGGGY